MLACRDEREGSSGLNCPRCEHQHSKVLESRIADAGDAMRRRRECLDCAFRFTTYERVELPPLWVAKHDGAQEPFARQKLLQGLVRACNKRDVPEERLEALVIEIETTLRRRHTKAVTSDDIGELALEGLLSIDHVAYVRFASVYRAFDSIDEFHSELERIANAAQHGGSAPAFATTGSADEGAGSAGRSGRLKSAASITHHALHHSRDKYA